MKLLRYFSLSLLVLAVSQGMAAQDGSGFWDNGPDKPFEIVASYGGTPYHPYRFLEYTHILPSVLVQKHGRFTTDVKTSMNLSVEGAWYFHPRMAATMLLSYHKMETGVYDPSSHSEHPRQWINEQTPYYIFLAGYRFLYVKKTHYRLYGELAGGYVWKDKSLYYFEFFPGEASRSITGEFIPLGLQTTGRLFLNAELLGFGEYSNIDISKPTLGVRFGLGYRF